MPPSLRKAVAAAIGGGAIAIASVLITGPSGDDGLEGVSYIPYKDIVGVWTVCYGHTGKDIMLGKTYTEAECKALLNKDLATVARQINPYIKVDIPETTRGALYSFVYNVGTLITTTIWSLVYLTSWKNGWWGKTGLLSSHIRYYAMGPLPVTWQRRYAPDGVNGLSVRKSPGSLPARCWNV